MHSRMVPVEVRGFAGKKQGARDRSRKLSLPLLRASRQNLAVASTRVGISLPIVDVTRLQAAPSLFHCYPQNGSQGLQRFLFQQRDDLATVLLRPRPRAPRRQYRSGRRQLLHQVGNQGLSEKRKSISASPAHARVTPGLRQNASRNTRVRRTAASDSRQLTAWRRWLNWRRPRTSATTSVLPAP